MTIEQAIKEAIKGGWNSEECSPPIGSRDRFDYSKMFLDPLFWQSLGKALGWRDEDFENVESIAGGLVTRTYAIWTWRNYWHSFIDHLAEGKTPEEFFKDLK